MLIKLFKICHDKEHFKDCKTDSLHPFNNLNPKHPELFEFGCFLEFYEKNDLRDDELYGLISPRFQQKTRLEPWHFIDWVYKNPGHDVYFINPFPHYSYLFKNVWENLRFFHPSNFNKVTQFFKSNDFGFEIDAIDRMEPKLTLYSNYFVGSKKFWDQFIAFSKPIAEALSKSELANLNTHYRIPAKLPVFIMERLFSTFLYINSSINHLAYMDHFVDMNQYPTTNNQHLVTKHLHTLCSLNDQVDGAFTSELYSLIEKILKTQNLSDENSSKYDIFYYQYFDPNP